MSVTIADIAREAGVSNSTVSRVMNGTKAVSPEVTAKVEATIQKYKYKPNALARGLIMKQTQTIGVVVPDISNQVFGELVKGIDSVCCEADYTILISQSEGKPEKEQQILDMLEDKSIDGVLFAGTRIQSQLLQQTKEKPYPVILVMQEAEGAVLELDTVIHDNWQAGFDAADFLIKNGHQRIGLIGGPDDDYSSGSRRTAGFMERLKEQQLSVSESYIKTGDFTFRSGYQAMEKIYQHNSELPTAVMACNDSMAIGAIQFIRNMDLSVPEDISVMGFDDLELASYMVPELTTVKVSYYEEGVSAAELLIERIKSPEAEPELVHIPHKVIRRKSVKRLKV